MRLLRSTRPRLSVIVVVAALCAGSAMVSRPVRPRKFAASAGAPESDTEKLPVPKGSTADMVALGARIFHGQVAGANCTGCHGANGTGSQTGPDLTKNRWLWSDGSVAGILKVITNGVPQPKQYRRPMPPMGGAELTADQASALAAYVWALSHQSK